MKTGALIAVSAFTLFQPETPPIDSGMDSSTEVFFDEENVKNGLVDVDSKVLSYFNDAVSNKGAATKSSRLFLLAKLQALSSDWEIETRYISSINQKVENENFKKIVTYGKEIIPAIIAELKSNPSQLVWALNYITGTRISSEKITIREASLRWVRWGEAMRII